MKNVVFIILFFFIYTGCSTNKSISKKYEVAQVNFNFSQFKTILVTDLRIKPKYSHNDLQKLMFQNFGKWTNVIPTKNETPYLVWTNIKLLGEKNELFTVAVSGKYEKFEILKVNGQSKYGELNYCSFIIFNSEGEDYLKEESEKKEEIAQYFVKAIESIKKNDLEFEKEFNNILLKPKK